MNWRKRKLQGMENKVKREVREGQGEHDFLKYND
jgi:hypothetical protein